MHDIEPVAAPTDPAPDVPEGTADLFLDLLLAHWPRIAAKAWEGYRTVGRGVVTIENGSTPPRLGYHVGAGCACHEDLVRTYDPATHAVVAVVETGAGGDEVKWIHPLSGLPTPEEAEGMVTADDAGATAH